jgi:hypothetical protein
MPDPNCDLDTGCCSAAAQTFGCLDDQAVTQAIQNLRDAGVPTLVVGVPGSDPYAGHLNAFAEAGGLPDPGATSYYAITAAPGVFGLAGTLCDPRMASCVISLDRLPDDPDLVTVLVDCVIVPKDPVDGGDGSYWVLDPASKTITLGGAICNRIMTEGATRMDYVFGCVTLTP